MQLSIIIVNYNVKYFLEQCLCAVLKACTNIEAEIFVVDNNSADGSKAYLLPKFPNVIFKWNTENLGFGKANNSVLSDTTGEYILFLNPDTIVPEDCFVSCINFLKTHKDCGALGVKMVNGSGIFLKESKRSFPSPAASFFKLAGLAKLFPTSKLFAKYYAGNLPTNKINEVDALAGAFMLLSKSAIESTKGFDEDFFMYGEDIDLSYRVQQAGFKNYYFPETTILHFKGESTQKLSGSYIKHFYGAMKLFVSKHYINNKSLKIFMLFAISISTFFAYLKLFFKKPFIEIANKTNAQNIAVVATNAEFNKLIHLLKYASPSVFISGRFAVDTNEKNTNTGNISDPEKFLKKNKITQVVFCEGFFSFKNIILQIEKFPKNLSLLFHAANSSSIVGDGINGEKGTIISKD